MLLLTAKLDLFLVLNHNATHEASFFGLKLFPFFRACHDCVMCAVCCLPLPVMALAQKGRQKFKFIWTNFFVKVHHKFWLLFYFYVKFLHSLSVAVALRWLCLIIFPVSRNFHRCFLFSTSGGVWEAEISYPSIYDSRFAVGVISDVRLLQRIYASQIFHFLHGWWIKSHLTKHKSTTLTYWELRWNKNRLVVASSESARERRAIVKKCWS